MQQFNWWVPLVDSTEIMTKVGRLVRKFGNSWPALATLCCRISYQSAQFLLLIKLTTTLIIISFSSGLLSAIMRAMATNALSAMRFEPLALYKMWFLYRNHTNKNAAMRLLPSLKEWFFITKYSKFAAFSSTLGYKNCPLKVWYIAASEPWKDSSFSLMYFAFHRYTDEISQITYA